MDLPNRVAVVTGASSGLGLQLVHALAHHHCQVYGLARRADRLDAIRDTIGPSFHALPCDVTDELQVRKAFDAIHESAHRVDILINGAGLGSFAPVDEMTPDVWDRQINTNLRGTYLCTRAVVPVMKEQNAKDGFGGHIVNIASIAAIVGNPSLSAYNASKFGVRGFSEATMKELREDGIRVTCVCPGSVRTPFFEKAGANMPPNPMDAEDVASTVIHVLQVPDNYLISEIVMRPLRPRG